MDILESLKSEFNIINDKLDFIVIALKEKEINKTKFDKYISIDAKREDIDYEED